MKSQVVKRSVVLDGHKSSVSLEDAFWMGLKEIACTRVVTLSGLVTSIDAQRQQGNLSSALRLYVLEFYRSQVPATDGWEEPRERMDRPEACFLKAEMTLRYQCAAGATSAAFFLGEIIWRRFKNPAGSRGEMRRGGRRLGMTSQR